MLTFWSPTARLRQHSNSWFLVPLDPWPYFAVTWLWESKLCYDRRSVSQSVLVSSTHLGPKTTFLLLSGDSCGFVDVGRPHWQLLLALASAVILGCQSRGTHDHILLSQFRDSPNLESKVPVFLSPRSRVAQLNSQALGSLFVASYDSQGYGGGIRPCLHTGMGVVHLLDFGKLLQFVPHGKRTPSP
jgi:hypothetical protein